MRLSAQYLLMAAAMATSGVAFGQATTYDYFGNGFTQVTAPYTNSDAVQIQLTLAGPLGFNLNDASETMTSFSFADGTQTITGGTANSAFAQFSTDASGAITGWFVDAKGPGSTEILSASLSFMADKGQINSSQYGSTEGAPGEWRLANVSTVPEPATMLLLGLGVAGIGFVRRRKSA